MTTRVRHTQRMPNWLVGLIVVGVISFASILAFSGLLGFRMPWQGGYEIKAVFASAQNVRQDSPVRIAGVNVGTVIGVEHLESGEEELTAQTDEETTLDDDESTGEPAAVVTMDLTEDALPIKEDAQLKLRPRLFLEGNYFVDLRPGSPGADEVDEGHVFPVNQTSYSVQLDQILTTLQSDVRRNLQVFLHEFGNALIKHGGAEGFREFFRSSAAANKFTSQVNEAFLGTQPGDLGGLIKGLDKVVRGLGRNERTLQDLVTNFRIFSGSFAAEDVALGQAIERLPDVLRSARPAFANLNASFPPLRAFAREALPGVRSTPETLRAATPFIEQVRALVSERELRGLVADLRPTIPELADLARGSIDFMKQGRALASCFNEVIIPWSNDRVEPVDPTGLYPHDAVGRVFEETGYVLTGLTAIGRNGDANGQWGRVLGQSGPNIVEAPALGEGPDRFALTAFPLLGSMPGPQNSAKTKMTSRHPCERQEPPSLQAALGAAPEQTPLPQSSMTALSDDKREALARVTDRIAALNEVEALRAAGDDREAERIIERAERAYARLGLSDGMLALGGEG